MTTIREMAQAATDKAGEVIEMIAAQDTERATTHETLMDAFDELDAAFARVFAQLPKPINPRGE